MWTAAVVASMVASVVASDFGAIVLGTIAVAGSGFMLWFLRGLLREGAPAVCYWVAPKAATRGWAQDSQRRPAARGAGEKSQRDEDALWDEVGWMREEVPGAPCKEFLENGIYAEKNGSSGLIALHVLPHGAGAGGRSVRYGGVDKLGERRL